MSRRQRRERRTRRERHARPKGWQTRHSVITGATISAGALLGIGATAGAATFQVDNTTDNGLLNGCDAGTADDCSLRGAITDANANANPSTQDQITFASSVTGTIGLEGTQLPAISEQLYIIGPGANVLTVSGNNGSRIFSVSTTPAGAQVGIYNLTLANGNASINGGAIFNANAHLKVANSVLSGNTATGNGGAIYDQGHDTEQGSYNLIYASTISGNTAHQGGGVYGYYSVGDIYDSTITANHTDTGINAKGAGVSSYSLARLKDSTIAGNGPTPLGGGIYARVGLGIYNSIVANNTATSGSDLATTLVGTFPTRFSLIEHPGSATIINAVPGSNITGQDPQLGPLQNNGGPTRTMKPAASSPVVDKGMSGFGNDQRQGTRVVDNPNVANSTAAGANAADMGAVELTLGEGPQAAPPAPVPVTPVTPHKKKCKKKKHKSSAQSAKKKCKKKKRR